MRAQLYLGVDLGTTRTKASVIDTNGQVMAAFSKTHNGLYPRDGWHEHEPERHWWQSLCELCVYLSRELGTSFKRVSSIAVSGIFPAHTLVDNRGLPLCNAILYDDSRAAAIAALMRKDESGSASDSNELIPRLVWFQEHKPDIWKAARMVLSSNGYVNYKLTGKYAIDSINAGVAGEAFDSSSGAWRQELLNRHGIPSYLLPQINPPSRIVGYLSKQSALILGLSSGIPVATGSGDTIVSALGAGAFEEGEILLNYGSMGIAVILREGIQNILDIVVSGIDGLGYEHIMILNNFGKLLEALGRCLLGIDEQESVALSDLDQKADMVPAARNRKVVFRYRPVRAGQRILTANPGADVLGVRPNTSRSEIFRAALECFGFELRFALAKLLTPPPCLFANGGGAASNVWRQVVTDINGVCQRFFPDSSCAYGTALLGAYAVNGLDLRKGVAALRDRSLTNTPYATAVSEYDAQYLNYLSHRGPE